MGGRERVRLIRCCEELQVVRARRKRKLLGTTTQWVQRACHPNHAWSYDSLFDQTEDARQLKVAERCLQNDEAEPANTHKMRPAETGATAKGGRRARVVRTLNQLIQWRGTPQAIRVDNGPEYLSQVFAERCQSNGVSLNYIQPGNRTRMPTSIASTGPSAMKCWTLTCSNH